MLLEHGDEVASQREWHLSVQLKVKHAFPTPWRQVKADLQRAFVVVLRRDKLEEPLFHCTFTAALKVEEKKGGSEVEARMREAIQHQYSSPSCLIVPCSPGTF